MMQGRQFLLPLAGFFLLLAGMPVESLGAERSVIVGFGKTPGPAENGLVHGAGGKVKKVFRLIPALSATMPEEALDGLRRNPHVRFVEEDMPTQVVEPVEASSDAEYDWGARQIGVQALHEAGIEGAGVKIAVLDTGIDYTHPDLAAGYRGGIDIAYGDGDPMDDSWNGHGTHVAGIVGAQRDGMGVAGIAPAAELYAVKVMDGGGFGTTSWLIAGLEWAVLNNMDIVNLSLELPSYSAGLEQACRAARDAGLLLVAAAGNTRGGAVSYPAAYESVIAVNGSGPDNSLGWFSATGPEVELAAPGVGILSTVRSAGYGLLSGTSQAAPHVAGVAALLLGHGVADANGNGYADAGDVRIRLRESAADLGASGADSQFGYGLVDARAAFGIAAPEPIRLTLAAVHNKAGVPNTTISLPSGLYRATVVNDSLRQLSVSHSGSSVVYSFGKRDPQRIDFVVDATAGPLELTFGVAGRPGATAAVVITR